MQPDPVDSVEPAAPPPSFKPNDFEEIGLVSSPFATLEPEDPYPTAPRPEQGEIAA